jgi:hypothetical protein
MPFSMKDYWPGSKRKGITLSDSETLTCNMLQIILIKASKLMLSFMQIRFRGIMSSCKDWRDSLVFMNKSFWCKGTESDDHFFINITYK